jgi:hypothetical protein
VRHELARMAGVIVPRTARSGDHIKQKTNPPKDRQCKKHRISQGTLHRYREQSAPQYKSVRPFFSVSHKYGIVSAVPFLYVFWAPTAFPYFQFHTTAPLEPPRDLRPITSTTKET